MNFIGAGLAIIGAAIGAGYGNCLLYPIDADEE